MRRLPLSHAAGELLRAVSNRTGLDRDRIMLGYFRSIDWQSLTFTGERHEIGLRLAPPDAAAAVARLRDGLADAEWSLAGHVVADIVITGTSCASDGSIFVALEALTLAD